MEIDDTPEPKTKQDMMFQELAPKKRLVFPIHQSIKSLISHEWENPDRKFFIPQAYKRKYPFSQEDCETWQGAPKIDPPVAKITKRNALPFVDSAVIKDPLDKRAEVYLRKNWEATTSAFQPLIATTSVARSLKVWMAELKDKVRETNPNQDFTQAFSTMDNAIAFMAEATADALELTARSAAFSNSARRTLWLKDWKGDTTSKAKLCGIPCEGKFLFGSALDNVLEFPIIP
ncbi:lamina-associated polypeptide 2, isoforms alpha/zeta-like [Dendropsophus ebraccatus]|uniref:lamina-associated polypeptide 2, isoforms alpha/zeta-like n=1 Tax=Dendropsophus ebraccatus TaxID=150705 RepID=UPI003831D11C